ncbi:hypothetical protein [Bosea sp. 124]|uniref:hypothetical protein n=1 Tax=Bosea sp. 124 TaxID=2135642 RepID=UPI0011B2024A|nr:hypothetical protein [Bosea sp. 124]
MAPRIPRQLDRDLAAILQDAAWALIDQLQSAGIEDDADLARRLNRRGFPCHGRSRWTAAAVRNIRRRRNRSYGAMHSQPQESTCARLGSVLGSPSAST